MEKVIGSFNLGDHTNILNGKTYYDKIKENKYVFIINGSGGVGKDAFVNFVSEIAPTINYSSVSRIKEIAKIIGWNGEKDEISRKFLSDLKILTTNYCDLSYKDMIKKIQEFENNNLFKYLFLHIREPEEIKKIKLEIKTLTCKTILIKNDSIKHIKSNMADENVFNYNYDYIILNNGTLDELKGKAREFIKLNI